MGWLIMRLSHDPTKQQQLYKEAKLQKILRDHTVQGSII